MYRISIKTDLSNVHRCYIYRSEEGHETLEAMGRGASRKLSLQAARHNLRMGKTPPQLRKG